MKVGALAAGFLSSEVSSAVLKALQAEALDPSGKVLLQTLNPKP